jgi:hypothetical protein
VRQCVHNGRSLSQQLQSLHQLQLDGLLQRKQQLSEQRARPRTERPDHSP